MALITASVGLSIQGYRKNMVVKHGGLCERGPTSSVDTKGKFSVDTKG